MHYLYLPMNYPYDMNSSQFASLLKVKFNIQIGKTQGTVWNDSLCSKIIWAISLKYNFNSLSVGSSN